MGYLILVRHGESRWNIANKFTGWVDVPLSEVGINEALIASKKLEGLRLDVAFTSRLTRAQETLLIILARQDYTGVFVHDFGQEKKWAAHKGLSKFEIPIFSNSDLNERYYGKLQGLDKDKARKKFGKEQVFKWRRSFDIPPPNGESLKDTCKRAIPYFKKKIMPHVLAGKNVIIAAHGNSLRGIIKHIDQISDEEIPNLELPTGLPIIYKHLRGKLVKENHIHSFDRPIHWAAPFEEKMDEKKKGMK
jgi:2,3-bisphosphoglycerate-dependent phosphoglycerate mutase